MKLSNEFWKLLYPLIINTPNKKEKCVKMMEMFKTMSYEQQYDGIKALVLNGKVRLQALELLVNESKNPITQDNLFD